MDIFSLRVAFSVVACVLLVLFYFGSYRTTRASFPGWWSMALLVIGLSTLCYLANGTDLQVVLNPLGNGLGVLGVEAGWCAARSLTQQQVRWRWLLIAPAIAVVAGALDDPAHNRWSGGAVYLVLTAGVLAVTTHALYRASARGLRHQGPTAAAFPVQALSGVSGILALFYGTRAVFFIATGPDGAVFTTCLDAAPTTLLLLVELVVLSFSMSSLSTVQQLSDLQQRAVYDQLTGLMRAVEFRDRAPEAVTTMARPGEVVMFAMADFDHFKLINDDFGHAVGDDVLRAFGLTARTVLGPRALCGRVGGEEFGLLFPATDLKHAERLLDALCTELQRTVHLPDARVPTISIGLVEVVPGVALPTLMQRADRALYEAKAQGRNRIVQAH